MPKDNLEIYNAVRSVPNEAQKPIQAGRLKGKTDINPMWRIKALTQQFGPAGFGWYYEITEKRLETGSNGEIAAFVQINLYVKQGEEWSTPIQGIGGSSFVTIEKNGAYTSDECFKMALTDAISVSCKALGFGADIYWNGDATKYAAPQSQNIQTNRPAQSVAPAPARPEDLDEAIDKALQAATIADLQATWKQYAHLQGHPDFNNAKNRRKAELTPVQ